MNMTGTSKSKIKLTASYSYKTDDESKTKSHCLGRISRINKRRGWGGGGGETFLKLLYRYIKRFEKLTHTVYVHTRPAHITF